MSDLTLPRRRRSARKETETDRLFRWAQNGFDQGWTEQERDRQALLYKASCTGDAATLNTRWGEAVDMFRPEVGPHLRQLRGIAQMWWEDRRFSDMRFHHILISKVVRPALDDPNGISAWIAAHRE